LTGGDIATFLGGGIVGVVASEVWRSFTRGWEVRKQRDAAALLVRDELQANIVRLRIARDGPEVPENLESATYRDLQMVLAQNLDRKALDAVRQAYIHARVPRAFQSLSPGPGGRPTLVAPIVPIIIAALEKAEKAHELLGKYVPKDAAAI
jgi:hypothetical protein